MDSQDHPSETVYPIQSSMRLSGLPQRIACRDRHPNPVLSEVTVQLFEFTRTRDGIEGTHAERGPLVGNRIDPVRVDDAALGPQEVETPLEGNPSPTEYEIPQAATSCGPATPQNCA